MIGMLTSKVSGFDLINDLLVRRTFIIQGLLMQLYFEFMQIAPFEFLSHSVLGFLFGGPIWPDPEGTIGIAYFRGEVHANASLWSDGYLNAGYFGMYVSAIAVGLFLALINYCTSRCDLRVACCSFAMIFMMICQTGVIKVVGTHGGLFACIIILIGDLRLNRSSSLPLQSLVRP
jgi:hypothetical protein